MPLRAGELQAARFFWLSWAIIEAKILYYDPKDLPEAFVEKTMPTDAVFDTYEQEYLRLCLDLDKPNTVVHKEYPGLSDKVRGDGMFEVDWLRPSVRNAHERLLVKAGVKPIDYILRRSGPRTSKKRGRPFANKIQTDLTPEPHRIQNVGIPQC